MEKIGELACDIRECLEREKKLRKLLCNKQRNFLKRYNDTFGIDVKGGYYNSLYNPDFLWTNLSYENIKLTVKIVEFMLNSEHVVIREAGKSRPARGATAKHLLESVNAEGKLHLLDRRKKFSPVYVRIIVKNYYSGYYIKDAERAKLWIKFMKELI